MSTAAVAAAERIPLALGERIGHELIGLLADVCDRTLVVGSVRRKVATVKDVELLLIPRRLPQASDLFGGVSTYDALKDRCEDLAAAGKFERYPEGHKLRAWGDKLKRFTFHGQAVELFILQPPGQWGLASVIRTGPADFSHQLVTPTNKTITTNQGAKRSGLMPVYYKVHDFGIYHHGTELVPTAEEEDVFRVVGRPYYAPEARR